MCSAHITYSNLATNFDHRIADITMPASYSWNSLLLVAERISARHLILQYSLATRCICMYVSHALECNYSCGDLRYITDIASATCTCYQATRGIAMRRLARLRKRRHREREMAEKNAVSRPGCISKHQDLVRRVSEDQSTMINYSIYLA